MSLSDWRDNVGTSDVLEMPVPGQSGPEDADLEAVIRLNLRHGRAAQRFGLFVSALAMLSIPMAIVLFMSYRDGARGGGTTFVLALWIVAFTGALIAALRSARLTAQLDAAARRVGAKRGKSVD